MSYLAQLQQLCTRLNEFALPRAIVDFDRDCFIAWNVKFLERTGYSEEEIKILKPTELIALGDSKFPLSTGAGNPPAEFAACVVRRTLQPPAAPGHIVESSGSLAYLMLQPAESFISTDFEQGRLVGQEEERVRVVQMFHDEVSSPLIGSLFAIERARQELETQCLPQAEQVTQASSLLTEASEKIREVLTTEKDEVGQSSENKTT